MEVLQINSTIKEIIDMLENLPDHEQKLALDIVRRLYDAYERAPAENAAEPLGRRPSRSNEIAVSPEDTWESLSKRIKGVRK